MNMAELFNYVEELAEKYDWGDENFPEQVRALFTTWCITGDMRANTSSCDCALAKIFIITRAEGIWKYDDFENFMLELII